MVSVYKNEFKATEILCPECGEICKIKFNDFKISLYDCENGHRKDDIEIDKFKETQKFMKTKYICDNCKNIQETTYLNNNKFYKCLTCNKNLCMICYEEHNKDHHVIKYELKNYFCKIHNQKYIFVINVK